MTFDFSRPGILPCQSIEALIAAGAITSATPFDADQVQPASLDLRLGAQRLAGAGLVPAGRPARCASASRDVAMHAARPGGRGACWRRAASTSPSCRSG